MKKQKLHQVINMLLSAFLVFSMFLTNAGQILVYASEAHTSNEDEEKTNEVIEMDETTSPLQIKTSEEEIQDLEKKFDEVYKDLSLILSEEQRSLVENMINSEELSSLLQEGIVLHETNDFKEATIRYEDLLFVLNQQVDFGEQIELIKEFQNLALDEKSLFEYKGTRTEEHSGEDLSKEEIEEDTSNDELIEQEEVASSVQEKTADPILSEKDIKYEGKLTRAQDGINSKPYGTEGYKTIRLVNNWVGKRVRITKEAVTSRATWAYVQVVGTNVSGWIDKKGIALDTITSQKDVLYDAKLLRATDGINSKPYGTEGYETNRLVGDLVDQQVRVTKEAVTSRATWAYIEVPETDISGWIDIKGIKLVETILSEKEVHYEGKLTRKDDGINTKPYGVAGYKTSRLVGNLVGKRVSITKEAVTPRAIWVYVQVKGTKISGWVDKKGIAIDAITSQKDVLYDAQLLRATDGINSKPYGTEGYKTNRLVDDLVGQQVRVTKEAVTPKATWAYIEVSETDISGWIDIKGIKLVETILSEKEVHYEGKLTRKDDGINTKPYGVAGYKTNRLVGKLVGKRVSITKEAVTPRATWAYIQVDGTEISGWIDKKGIEIDSITSQKKVEYDAKLLRATDGINSKPYGTEGYKTNRLVGDLVGQQVRVTKEAVTPRATWAYIEVPGKDISGWINIKGLKLIETILSEKTVNYEGKLTRKNDGINTKPYGVAGYKTNRLVGDLVGKRVTITKEAVTPRATWVYIQVSGTNIVGWIDKAGIQAEKIISQKNVNYSATLKRSNDGINSKPYGIEGYKTIRLVKDWVGKEVRVTKEATTSRSTWAYVEVIGTNIAGWIDKKGLKINRTVYLDPGHGGSDSGASYSGIYEKNLNLAVSLKVRNLLEKKGYNVVMSRTNDKTVGLYDRPAEANKIGADIFVSIHHNAMPGNSTVTGIETYHYKYSSSYPPKKENLPYHNDSKRLNNSLKLSNSIHGELISNTSANDRKVKGSAFVVVRETHMPAVLLELGYMTSPSELKKLQTNSYQDKMAKAIFNGIDSYFK